MGRSGQFGVNILVTVYYEEHLTGEQGDVIEESIGIGQVVNIQKNGLIQVRGLKEGLHHAALWNRIRDREMAILQHVIIKPSFDFNDVGIEVRFDE
jgi:hypothetical protein